MANVNFKFDVTGVGPLWDVDAYYWINDNVGSKVYRQCPNNKDSFDIVVPDGQKLHVMIIVYALNGTDYTIKYKCKKDGANPTNISPDSPIEDTITLGNTAKNNIVVTI